MGYSATMILAHVSDPHFLSPGGVALNELEAKHLSGAANLWFKRRGRSYRSEHVEAVVREAARVADHVVMTGDIANLALAGEFERALRVIGEAGLGPDRLTVVPGNHDVYTFGSFMRRRYRGFFARYQESDLPELGVELGCGLFPFVRLRGPVALIGLSSAVPRPPFVAGGVLGVTQLDALARVLDHPEVRRRTPVLLIHHPPLRRLTRLGRFLDGLSDGDALLRLLLPLRHALLLHGHLHVRERRTLTTPSGEVQQLGATSAALEDPRSSCRAAVNLYDLDGEGRLASAWSHVLQGASEGKLPSFARAEIPRAPGS
jgi:3',5'-cyclic AMP phosphodiesterase CpdA